MSTKKKQKEKKYRRRKELGPWFQVGQVLIVLGAILIIVAAVLDLIEDPSGTDGVWSSYTFGQIGVPFLAAIIAIVVAVLIIWMAVDKRFPYSLHLIAYATIIIVLAILAGNVGALVVIIGALIIIFYHLSKS